MVYECSSAGAFTFFIQRTPNLEFEWKEVQVLPEYILAGVDFFSNYENEGSGTGCLRVGFSHVHGFLLDKSGAQHFNLEEKANLNHS